MKENNSSDYRNMVFYQVYVRNHTLDGTLSAFEADLPRIHSMGADVIYLLPVFTIGKLHKKGILGCPYSIADYQAVNPEYGNLADFAHLVKSIHDLGMKVMIDIVFNHTAHDSVLVHQHPDWFHQDQDGRPISTVPEWSDVIDLKFPNAQLEGYLIDTLIYWVKMGVDGFRCDVASLIPLDFWKAARVELENINPNIIWLAESVHADFVLSRRANDLRVYSDSELFTVFDICYDYDIWPVFQKAITGQILMENYLNLLRFQEAIFPQNGCKLRFVENHDQERIMGYLPNVSRVLAATAMAAFNNGPLLLYGGQESGAKKRPSLFNIDKVKWGRYKYQHWVTRLISIKRHPAQRYGRLLFTDGEPAVVGYWINGEKSLLGIFNIAGNKGKINVSIPNGEYRDLLTGAVILVKGGMLDIPESAWVLEYDMKQKPAIHYKLWF